MSDSANGSSWYWSLTHNKAVPESDRGPDEDVLGPYPSKQAAENWKAQVEERNSEWEADDEEWDGTDADGGTRDAQ